MNPSRPRPDTIVLDNPGITRLQRREEKLVILLR